MDSSKKTIYRLLTIIFFLLLLIVFTIQNTQVVTVKLFFWNIPMSSSLLILISFATGLLFGWLGISIIATGKRKEAGKGKKIKEK